MWMVQMNVGGCSAQVRGILFDKDGTLLQFISLWGWWAETVLSGLERELKKEGGELPEHPGYILGVYIEENGSVRKHDRQGPLAMGSPSQMIGIATYLLYKEGVPWNEAVQRVTEVFEYANEQVLDRANIVPISGVVPFLERCRELDLPMAVVTADDKRPSEQHLEKMGIRQYFAAVIGDDCVEHGKPYPDMVELACRELGLQPHEVAVIGDSVGDMEMGHSAGSALQVFIDEERQFDAKPAKADVMIRAYDEIELTL
ncbi:HAD family hydrolase [Paenibacillus apiarius]|uniref:HAD family hydrolase n=1 Tax=Paenibacillus apiarius TaxID=46240 RepID=UPI001F091E5E|nr:HAD family hydrolase [Paenibacillus apiarius]